MTLSPEFIERRAQMQAKRNRYINSLKYEDKVTLANNWVNNLELEGTSKYWKEADSCVHTCLSDFKVGYELIALIWSSMPKTCNQSYLGVLIEDWLARYELDGIEKIENLALEDPEFKEVLKYVYKNSMSELVYQRVMKAREKSST